MKNITLALTLVFTIPYEPWIPAWAADNHKMLEIQVGDRRIAGRIFAHNDQLCWFLQRDGRLHRFAINDVSEFTEIDPKFKVNSFVELKNQLQKEFGKPFEVRTSSHYVVAARSGTAESYAALFERIYREFVRSFRTRGFKISDPEFPLVAIVFPDENAFTKYCQSEGISLKQGLVGYYLPKSNRVAMYERQSGADVDAIVIHEATHQVAFNVGIHSRLAMHPKWVVEGLATVFEAEGIRMPQGAKLGERVNRDRYLWFQEYAKTRRQSHFLTAFIQEDRMFETATLDAYGEAWALSFYLVENRASEYSKFLKKLVERDPLIAYDADARLKDFKETFGGDVDEFESTYLRFIKRIADR